MAENVSNTDYYLADIATKKHPDELRIWWLRELWILYNAYKVKFEGRQVNRAERKDILSFRLARDESLGVFHVDLKDGYEFAWSDLPSTIQFATSDAPYGFLLLSPKWAVAENARLKQEQDLTVDIARLAEPGGKWPISAAEKELKRLIREQVPDKALQELLLGLLNNLLK